MEHFDLVEKLVNTFGVSYEEAKKALEKCGWDPVEAAVILERAKNGMPVDEEPQPEVNTDPKGSFSAAQNNWKQEGEKFFSTIWEFLSQNEFVVKKPGGDVFLELPIWIAVLLLCAFFWAVVIILGIVFVMGYRFSFTGPQLGKFMNRGPKGSVNPVPEDIVEEVKIERDPKVSADPVPEDIIEEAKTQRDPEPEPDLTTETQSNDVQPEGSAPEEPSANHTDPTE